VATAIIMILRVGKNNRAFSLLELMLVLVLLGLSSLIALPAIDKGLKARQARQAALGLAAVARELSSRARSEGVPQQLVVNVSNNSYLAARSREIQLPADMKFSQVEGGETLEPSIRQFIFFPNGSNLGGRIDLVTDPSTIAYSVRLHPLTGKVEVSRGDRQ
jgi:prepilin-type N-terminal cleavage/methylation domain-containing protein